MKKDKGTRLRLLEAALEQIWKSSYSSVGIVQICNEAQTTKGSFYHFFKSKSDLAIAALDEHWNQTRSEFDRAFAPGRAPVEQIAAFCQQTIRSQHVHRQEDGCVLGCPFFTTGMESTALEESVQKAVDRIVENETAYFTRLAREIGGSRFPDELAAADGGKTMFAFVQGVLAMARVQDDVGLIERVLQPGLMRLAWL